MLRQIEAAEFQQVLNLAEPHHGPIAHGRGRHQLDRGEFVGLLGIGGIDLRHVAKLQQAFRRAHLAAEREFRRRGPPCLRRQSGS